MLRTRTYRRRIENRIRPRNTWVASLESMNRSRETSRTVRNLIVVGVTCVAILLIAVLAQGLAASVFSQDRAGAVVAEYFGGGGEPGEADGVVSAELTVSVFDDHLAAVTRLNPELLAAVRQAATDASAEGIEFFLNSGWRSPALQNSLLEQAVHTYGSREEASRWVAPAESSSHVSGDAVDIGPFDATYWLSQYGGQYGLCQTYSNESWHYELRPEAVTNGCPEPYLDPTADPRLQ